MAHHAFVFACWKLQSRDIIPERNTNPHARLSKWMVGGFYTPKADMLLSVMCRRWFYYPIIDRTDSRTRKRKYRLGI